MDPSTIPTRTFTHSFWFSFQGRLSTLDMKQTNRDTQTSAVQRHEDLPQQNRQQGVRWAEILQPKTALFTCSHISSYLEQNTHMRLHTLSRTYRYSSCVLTQTHTNTAIALFHIQISLEQNSHLGESNKVSILPLSVLSRSRLVDFSLITSTSQSLCALAYVRTCNQLVYYSTVSLVNMIKGRWVYLNVTKGQDAFKGFKLEGDSSQIELREQKIKSQSIPNPVLIRRCSSLPSHYFLLSRLSTNNKKPNMEEHTASE